jgi:CHRD domain-containing protein
MQVLMRWLCLLAISLAIILLVVSPSIDGLNVFGQTEKFRAKLSAKNEIPKVNSTASGSANFKSKKDDLTWKINITGMGNAIGAKIYLGNKSQKGEPIADLMKSNNWSRTPLGIRMNGTISASDLQGPLQGNTIETLKSAMTNGSAYVNILTESHPDGELRGQIKMLASKTNQTNLSNITSMNITTSNITLTK